jgi:putative oxidoreductase
MKRLSPTVTWSLSIFLALLFAALGSSKLWGPSAARWGERFLNWGYPAGSHYLVGAVEMLSGLALLLPRSRKAAAGSLMLVMVGALGTHLIHGELPRVIPPLILGVLALLLFLPRLGEGTKPTARAR